MSAAIEEYLRIMYLLWKSKEQIRVTDIAEAMSCTKPSVNRALKVLKEDGFITYEAYGEIHLTPKGESVGEDIVRRHETLKAFLIQILDVDKETADKEASSMKHAVSEDTVKRFENYIKGIIDVSTLICDYDPNSAKCKECVEKAGKKRLQYALSQKK